MRTKVFNRALSATGLALVLSISGQPALAQPAERELTYDTSNGEWRTYGGDLSSTRYSALDQINAENFNDLELAWRFQPDNLGPRPDPNLQATPLMVDGVLYLTAGTRRAAVALDSRTGELLWKYNIDEGERGQRAPRAGSGRGLSYWTDGTVEHIIYVTPGYQMIALDAKSGRPVPGFGEDGVVDLKKEMGADIPATADVGLHATPLVVGNVIVVGAAHLPSMYLTDTRSNVKGKIRGYDARTGELLWTFHPVPRAGEFGYDTWLEGSAERVGNTGSWTQMSADPELGLVYVGIELPTGDWYGGHRPGAGLFGESVVALDVKTGERRWHYQTVHHGIWDMDIPSAAVLADIEVDGRKIKALAQPTKHAFLFVLDRETGEPVWPIEERPVPQGDVPTEWYSPTQPHVTKPPAFDRQGVTVDDLIDFTPELHAEALALVEDYKLGESVFSPPSMSKWPRPLGTIVSPTGDGAGQWPGGSLDPETNIFYIFSNLSYGSLGIVPGDPQMTELEMMRGQASDPDASPGQRRGGLTVQDLPLLKPPYGRITAIDLDEGEIVWQVPHGATPDEVRDHPLLAGMDIPRTGSTGKVGTLVTETLVIAGDGTPTTGEDGELGAWLRAYDKATGREVGQVRMDTRVTGSPMTYSVDGRQYIVVATSSPGIPGELVAYRLP
jgi:quinoprotein glucose dehydrogenase